MAQPLWVFGYGSLIWNPGFPVAERVRAVLHDHKRSFCMWSIHHRGTPDAPGLVLALDAAQSQSCAGVAFRAETGTEDDTLAYLRQRELVSSAYLEVEREVIAEDGRQVRAVTFVVDRDHCQYCGDLSLDRQVEVIAAARGGRGHNAEYLFNTADHLTEIGLHDPILTELAHRVRLLHNGRETG